MTARLTISCAALLLLAPAAACLAEDSEEALLRQVLSELEALTRRVEEAEKRLIAVDESRSVARAMAFPLEGRGKKSVSLRYSGLSLPAKPTLDQAREYVLEMKKRHASKDYWSIADPEPELLARVGGRNFEALLDALDEGQGGYFNKHCLNAMKLLADEEHLALVLERLPSRPVLIELVIEKGWEGRARDVLVREVSSARRSLPAAWIEAVAAFEDPGTFEPLLEYMKRDYNFLESYESISRIRSLPGEKLDAAVAELWTRTSKDGEKIRHYLEVRAWIAARHGHLDALECLMEGLSIDREKEPCESLEQLLEKLEPLLPLRGTPEKLRAWFLENRGRLRFDRERKQYRVKED